MGEPVGVGEVDDAPKITTEYRKEKTGQETWSSKFVAEYVNGRKTVNRKCIKRSTIIKSVDGSTSAMAKHAKLCDPKPAPTNQSLIPYKVCKLSTTKKGLDEVARLVFEDNIPINNIVSSQTHQMWFKRMNFDKVTHASLNETLEIKYHIVVQIINDKIKTRNAKQLLGLSFDKWTSTDKTKFLGVYLYLNGENICLGTLYFTGICGAEEVIALWKTHLKLFDLHITDIGMFITDLGSDMQLCARLCKIDNFPCLAHILNIIAKRFILQNAEAEDAQNDDFGFDPDIEVTPPDHAYESTIQKVRAIVRKAALCNPKRDC